MDAGECWCWASQADLFAGCYVHPPAARDRRGKVDSLRLGRGDAIVSCERGDYQMRTRSLGASHIGSFSVVAYAS
jgi:hypothetical protein